MFHLNLPVLFFAVAISMITALVCGLSPRSTSWVHPAGDLDRVRQRFLPAGGAGKPRSGLVIAQIAISMFS